MPNTPDLTQVAEEIKAVLTKHGIAALITLIAPGKMEFVRSLSPPWSCVVIEDTPQGPCIKLSAKRVDSASLGEHQERIRQTIEMLMGFQFQAEQDAAAMAGIIKEASRFVDISSSITYDRN